MGSEILGQMILGQITDGVIVNPEWVEKCIAKSDWSIVPIARLVTKQCEV